MSLWIGFVLWALLVLAIAALAATRRGARAAVLLAAASLPLAGLVQTRAPFGLAVLAVGMLFCLFRAWDFASGPAMPGFGRRLLHLVAIVDTRRIVRREPRFDRAALGRLGLALAVAAAALWCVALAEDHTGWRHYALRWYAGGVLFTFAAFEAVDALLVLLTTPFGLAVPPVNRAPYLSTSVAEFWSRRWNSIIGAILREHVYRPVRRRGATVAMLATFGFSAAFHAYLIGLALGPWQALAWVVFFLLQPPLLAIERRLGVRRWASVPARAWTLGSLGLLCPGFIEPLLQLVERI